MITSIASVSSLILMIIDRRREFFAAFRFVIPDQLHNVVVPRTTIQNPTTFSNLNLPSGLPASHNHPAEPRPLEWRIRRQRMPTTTTSNSLAQS